MPATKATQNTDWSSLALSSAEQGYTVEFTDAVMSAASDSTRDIFEAVKGIQSEDAFENMRSTSYCELLKSVVEKDPAYVVGALKCLRTTIETHTDLDLPPINDQSAESVFDFVETVIQHQGDKEVAGIVPYLAGLLAYASAPLQRAIYSDFTIRAAQNKLAKLLQTMPENSEAMMEICDPFSKAITHLDWAIREKGYHAIDVLIDNSKMPPTRGLIACMAQAVEIESTKNTREGREGSERSRIPGIGTKRLEQILEKWPKAIDAYTLLLCAGQGREGAELSPAVPKGAEHRSGEPVLRIPRY